jgi:hypothetical protein
LKVVSFRKRSPTFRLTELILGVSLESSSDTFNWISGSLEHCEGPPTDQDCRQESFYCNALFVLTLVMAFNWFFCP